MYHAALHDLGRKAREFAAAIEHAGDCAARLPRDAPDDLVAIQVARDCNTALARAFARTPGMIQVLTGLERRSD
jgi:hypothetical protein